MKYVIVFMYGLVQVYIFFVFFGVDISPSTMSISLLSLKELWSNIDDEVDVYEFYGHSLNDWGPSSPLSNFFEAEYEYTIPEWVFECVAVSYTHLTLPTNREV